MSHQLIDVCYAECKSPARAIKIFEIAKCLGIKTIEATPKCKLEHPNDTCIMYGDDNEILVCGIDFPREAMPTNEIPLNEFIDRMLNMHNK